jgi:hypothetical protein
VIRRKGKENIEKLIWAWWFGLLFGAGGAVSDPDGSGSDFGGGFSDPSESIVSVDADLGGSSAAPYTCLWRVGLMSRAGLGLTGTSGPSGLPPTGAVSGTLAVSEAGLVGCLESWLEPYNAAEVTRQCQVGLVRQP